MKPALTAPYLTLAACWLLWAHAEIRDYSPDHSAFWQRVDRGMRYHGVEVARCNMAVEQCEFRRDGRWISLLAYQAPK